MEDLVGVGRFGQVGRGAQMDRFGGGGDAAVAGEDHHGHLRGDLMGGGYQLQAGAARHSKVDHRQLRPLPLDNGQGAIKSVGSEHCQAPADHGLLQPLAKGLLIVHQDNFLPLHNHRHLSLINSSLKLSRMVLPRPGVELISSPPP